MKLFKVKNESKRYKALRGLTLCMKDAEFSAIVCFACFQILWWNAEWTFLTPFMCAAKDLKYMPNMFDVHVTVKVWNQYCFCIFQSTKHYFMVKWRKAHHRLGTSSNMWAAAWQNQKKWLMRRAKTQISLGICPVWSVFAVRIRNLALLATHWAHRWAHSHFVGFVVQQLIWLSYYKANIKIIFVSLYQTIYNCI